MEFHKLSARELADAIATRQMSAREALAAHYARIDAVNPAVNAVVTQVRELAQAQATRADEVTASTPVEALAPLHGVPMTHKDTHNTKGIRTTFGSPVLAENVPGFNDLVIDRLQAAGVVSTGKNNVPEFAAGSNTVNTVFGSTKNPYDLTLTAGGSSGGLAAALATGIQPLGEGSDMGGSLRNPAAFCNVVGFRPSWSLVPFAPHPNASNWLARYGPMARTVQDVALMMSVITGRDPRVPAPCPADPAEFDALASEPGGADHPLTGVRVAVTTDFGLGIPVDDTIVAIVLEQAKVFEQLGAQVVRACPDLSEADHVFDVTRAYDMATTLRGVVAQHPEQVKADVIWNVTRGLELTSAQLMESDAARTRLRAATNTFYDQHDVLLTPTTQVLPFNVETLYPTQINGVPMQTYVEWMRSVCVISATSHPAISVPGGFTDAGLPVGIQLVGGDGRDVQLLRVARAYEEATRFAERVPVLP